MKDNNQLPPLPEPEGVIVVGTQALRAFTADQMRAYALQARAQATQAEAKTDKPAAVRNPFASRCYTMSESHLSGHRLIVGFEKLEDTQDAHEWVARQVRGDFTHQAPSVPDAVVLTIHELREIQRAVDDFSDCGETDVPDRILMRGVMAGYLECTNYMVVDRDGLRDAIDAAMLAAKEGGA